MLILIGISGWLGFNDPSTWRHCLAPGPFSPILGRNNQNFPINSVQLQPPRIGHHSQANIYAVIVTISFLFGAARDQDIIFACKINKRDESNNREIDVYRSNVKVYYVNIYYNFLL